MTGDQSRPRFTPSPSAYDYAVMPNGKVYKWDAMWARFREMAEEVPAVTAENDDDALCGDVIEGDWSRTR